MVIIAKLARADLHQIFDYIARDSQYYAKKVVRSLVQQLRSIDNFPMIGRMVPELHNENIREIVYDSYRIVYRIGDNIEVAAFMHIKRNLEETMKDRLN